MKNILKDYAKLLVHYSLEIQGGDRLFIQSTTLAEPLVREVYKEALQVGAHVEHSLSMEGQNQIFYRHSQGSQLDYVPVLLSEAMKHFDAYLHIRAPFNLNENKGFDIKKQKRRSKALASLNQIYFERTGSGEMKRSLCQYPCQANAQAAGMSLADYEEFVFRACKLDHQDPIAAWKVLSAEQELIVERLSRSTIFRFKSEDSDISFSTAGRTWINSDGKANMPSGEVFTAPVEDSVNGHITFNFPAIHSGHEVENVKLWVENGKIIKWSADRGQEYLDEVFKIPGAVYFGEAAIGTNYDIKEITKNILFDEKIGGAIHMAIGQSYKQCGGKNQSEIHWDMIKDMKKGGRIYADNELIYENGKFLKL